ncbi:MAG: glycine betaine/L-proline ABC transporter ATP-binding protein [Aestuariivirga sp.]
MAAQPILVCRNVWKIFGPGGRHVHGAPLTGATVTEGHIAAVRDVSLDVNEGEIFVIMGLSGSGKSTLVRCLSRLIEPSAGQILFKGENLLAASDTRMIEIRRHHMGMVFQHFALLPHLDVLANVAFPLEIQGIARPERERRALQMIELVGLAGKERVFPRQLSGGQQQRVGIARSLAVEPELWFLDEPFSALDPLIRREMQDEFIRLQSGLRKTIVFITHDFDEALRLADKIAVMKDGVIEQAASPEDIVLRPATPYVAAFTKGVSRAKVVRVSSVMKSGAAAPAGPEIMASARIGDAAALFAGGVTSLRVVGPDRQPIGRIDRDDVIDMLLGGER